MFFKFNFYAFVWASCMFALNLGRLESLPTLQVFYFIYFDKVAHFLQFSILSFLTLVGFYKQYTYPYLRFNGIKVTLLLTIGFAVILEGIHFVRAKEYFEWADLLANVLGSACGILIFYQIYKKNDEN